MLGGGRSSYTSPVAAVHALALLLLASIAWAQTSRAQCVTAANKRIGDSPREANAYVSRALCYMPNGTRSASWSDLQVAVNSKIAACATCGRSDCSR